MNTALQYLFCAHLLVKKRWTQEFAFLSSKKKRKKITRRYTPASINSNNTMFSHRRWFTSAFFFRREQTNEGKKCTFFAMHWPLHTFHIHNSFSLFDALSPSYSQSARHSLYLSLCLSLCHSCIFWAFGVEHSVPGDALYNSSSDKKDICFVAQNLTGVKEILGKDTHTHTQSPIFVQHTNDEKRWRDSKRRRAKNGNAKNWIRVWNMHFRIFLLFHRTI